MSWHYVSFPWQISSSHFKSQVKRDTVCLHSNQPFVILLVELQHNWSCRALLKQHLVTPSTFALGETKSFFLLFCIRSICWALNYTISEHWAPFKFLIELSLVLLQFFLSCLSARFVSYPSFSHHGRCHTVKTLPLQSFAVCINQHQKTMKTS